MIPELITAGATLKAMGEIALALRKIKSTNDVAEKAIELNFLIMSLQASHISIQAANQALLDENNQLKQQAAQLEDWNSRSRRYELKELAPGALVYTQQYFEEANEVRVYCCTNCYQERQLSILQRSKQDFDGTHHVCPRCKSDVVDWNDPQYPTI